MQSFFYYFGIFSFIVVAIILGYILYSSYALEVSEKIRKYNDYCYLTNIGMTQKEFDKWFKDVRTKMSESEFKVWQKQNTHTLSSWIIWRKNKKTKIGST